MPQKEASIPTAVSADNAKRLESVKDSENYYVTLQFGSKRNWRQWSGHPRKRVPNAGGGFDHVHDPVLHERIGPFPGKIVNGLIGEHNEWVKDYNRRKEGSYSGHLDRQLLVLDTELTTDIPEESKHNFGNLQSFTGAIEAIVQQKIAEVIGSGA